MDQYNNNINENQKMDCDNNVNTKQNVIPQEQQINQADLYATYSQSQQNLNQPNYSDNGFQQSNNSYSNYNQQYTQNSNYDNTYSQQPYGQSSQNNGYNMYNQPQQYNDAYFNQQYPTYNFQEKPKGFAIASMILGIFSFLFSCCIGFFTLFTSIAGLVLGIISLKKNEGGKGMAIAGIILSSVGILCSIFSIIMWIAELFYSNNIGNPYHYYGYY